MISISRDGWLIIGARTLRSFAFGFFSVHIALYLRGLGYDEAQIGLLLSIALGGSAALTIILSGVADRWGRRRVLIICGLLMCAAGLVFAASDNLVALLLAALTGAVSVTSSEVGAFIAVEQATLPQTAPHEQRTTLFSLYNFTSYAALAVGALASGLPDFLRGSVAPVTTQRLLYLGYGMVGAAVALLYTRLSAAVEVQDEAVKKPLLALGLGPSRAIVLRLAGLQSVDAFAGGLVVQSLIALWLNLRFGVGGDVLGVVFFFANLCSTASLLAAPAIARRIGLLNAMVFTHLPSNLLLMLIPLMPSFELAVLTLLLRQCLSQMDVPTRQAYTMALVAPDERSAAAGVTVVARAVANAISPSLSGIALRYVALGLPFIAGGLLKSGYDIALYFTFRNVPLPVESEGLKDLV
ncbi:MAG: MFS transporter [Candidatus Chloroheliales bacterium]|nr:MAG: MFS transporter [Chloroflexota bacterium]